MVCNTLPWRLSLKYEIVFARILMLFCLVLKIYFFHLLKFYTTDKTVKYTLF